MPTAPLKETTLRDLILRITCEFVSELQSDEQLFEGDLQVFDDGTPEPSDDEKVASTIQVIATKMSRMQDVDRKLYADTVNKTSQVLKLAALLGDGIIPGLAKVNLKNPADEHKAAADDDIPF